ncbi:MAG: hypothetical protein HKN76_10210 [Saprospiraceae bacterium]|nr:hypothetical protein [Saprospiraceae bacterium]
MHRKIYLQLILSICAGALWAQDLANLEASDLLTLDHSGSLSLSSRFYDVSGINPRSTNFWALSGRYTLTAGGFSFPISFSLRESGLNTGISHPFNRFGISPYYKWAKLHLGHRNISFSPYTLAGKTINGVGLELTPGKFRFSAIYGKMRNYQINHLPDDQTILLDLHQRLALGAKIGYGTAKNHFDLMFFKGVDQNTNVAIESKDPNDNLVIGAKLHLTLLKKIVLESNFALSGFTENRASFDVTLDPNLQQVESLVDLNASSRVNFAGDARLRYRIKQFNLGVQYRRIDPLFQSLGTMYFQTDIEHLKFDIGTTLFRQKVNFQGSMGIEKNNLRNKKAIANDRLIMSANLSFSPNEKISSILSFSNYQQNSAPTFDLINDTFRLTTVSQTFFLNTQYHLKVGSLVSHSVNISLHRNTISDQSPVDNLGSDIATQGAHLRYKLGLKATGLTISPGIRYSSYDLPVENRARYGITLAIQKPWLQNKLHTSINGSYQYSDVNSLRNGDFVSGSINIRYAVMKKTSLNLRLYHTQRTLVINPSFREWRGSIGLNTGF